MRHESDQPRGRERREEALPGERPSVVVVIVVVNIIIHRCSVATTKGQRAPETLACSASDELQLAP